MPLGHLRVIHVVIWTNPCKSEPSFNQSSALRVFGHVYSDSLSSLLRNWNFQRDISGTFCLGLKILQSSLHTHVFYHFFCEFLAVRASLLQNLSPLFAVVLLILRVPFRAS